MNRLNEPVVATLPINLDDGLSISPARAKDFGESLSGLYCFAEPYPHIVIDNFLPNNLIESLINNFPGEALENDITVQGDYAGHHKRQISPYDCNSVVRHCFNFFNSAPFLQFLEGMTRIKGIIADPYFSGGGFHEVSTGGKLGIHADFRINEKLHLSRRLNVLIYLNKDWKKEYCGELEIWDKEMKVKVKSIAPIFNRCVIFNTDANSFHGHPDPLSTPKNIKRRSAALYYYTASEKIYDDIPAHMTMYASRPNDGAEVKKQVRSLNMQNYKNDLTPPALRNPRLLLPPFLYRKLKSLRDFLGSKN